MADSPNNDPPGLSPIDQFCREYFARLCLGNSQRRLILIEIQHVKILSQILSKEFEIMIRDDETDNEQSSIQDIQDSLDQLKLEESRLVQRKQELIDRIDRMKHLIELNQYDPFDSNFLQ